MGKALITAARWFAPLGAWLGPRRSAAAHPTALARSTCALPPRADAPPPRHEESPEALQAEAVFSAAPLSRPALTQRTAWENSGSEPAPKPLRVLRIRESRANPRHAGRLVISGRMADVCAELERLAAAHPGLLH